MGEIKKRKQSEVSKLPVTTLCGFLGAGKTTLLRHILETKHNDSEPFRCAVIVNDMAELNIDKSLIDRTALVQSDEVVSMQNGCVCCTLQSDLVEQITSLAKSGKFDYMVIEASGVSEPAEIASLFAECDEEHEHEDAHKDKEVLADVATLDTCVTVLDSAEFFTVLETVKAGPKSESLSQLLVEQVEYSNVVILNKTDLVNQSQIAKIKEYVTAINKHARILIARNSSIDVMEVINTGMYKPDEFNFSPVEIVKMEAQESCCKSKLDAGEPPCCKSARTIDTGKSKVVLGSRDNKQTRHSSRFGVGSFLYHARRPFHPVRFHQNFVEKYFVFVERKEEEEEGSKEENSDENADDNVVPVEVALQKQTTRNEEFGVLCRSKGFVWMSNTHDLMGCFGQAGNSVTIESPGPWYALDPRAYVDDETIRKEFRKDFEGTWGDRRQELVFIGIGLKHQAIQKVLDECLLTDEEFNLGVDGWKATIGDLFLDGDEEEGEDDEVEEEPTADKKE